MYVCVICAAEVGTLLCIYIWKNLSIHASHKYTFKLFSTFASCRWYWCNKVPERVYLSILFCQCVEMKLEASIWPNNSMITTHFHNWKIYILSNIVNDLPYFCKVAWNSTLWNMADKALVVIKGEKTLSEKKKIQLQSTLFTNLSKSTSITIFQFSFSWYIHIHK